MSRADSESLRSGCCGARKSTNTDVARIPQRGKGKRVEERDSGGLGDNKVESATLPNEVAEWEEELPECCK